MIVIIVIIAAFSFCPEVVLINKGHKTRSGDNKSNVWNDP
jgi:hypothetical protein